MSRNSMLAMAELYTRADAVNDEISIVDDKLKRLLDERRRLVTEHDHIAAGIDAIGLANGLLKQEKLT